MPKAEDIYVKCDDLDAIPTLMRDNYLYESNLLTKLLPKEARVLQVGSMDGERGIRLLRDRPDIRLSGLEIEEKLVNVARGKVADANLEVQYIHGDITNPPDLPPFDYVICLNNSFGYIPDQDKALAGMKKLGDKIIVSVYGEKFTDKVAKEYFDTLGLTIKNIHGNTFMMEDFTEVKRYTRAKIASLSKVVHETPAGYFCIVTV